MHSMQSSQPLQPLQPRLFSDVVWTKEKNVNTAAYVTIVLCKILFLHDVLGSLQVQ